MSYWGPIFEKKLLGRPSSLQISHLRCQSVFVTPLTQTALFPRCTSSPRHICLKSSSILSPPPHTHTSYLQTSLPKPAVRMLQILRRLQFTFSNCLLQAVHHPHHYHISVLRPPFKLKHSLSCLSSNTVSLCSCRFTPTQKLLDQRQEHSCAECLTGFSEFIST